MGLPHAAVDIDILCPRVAMVSLRLLSRFEILTHNVGGSHERVARTKLSNLSNASATGIRNTHNKHLRSLSGPSRLKLNMGPKQSFSIFSRGQTFAEPSLSAAHTHLKTSLVISLLIKQCSFSNVSPLSASVFQHTDLEQRLVSVMTRPSSSI
jgi:hypothetical protein